MAETGFHFAQPAWLWGLLVIPLVLGWLSYTSPFKRRGLEANYADPQLMPYLSGEATTVISNSTRPLAGWALAWSLLILSLAGPRWDYRQINPFEAGADLVILLDISASMKLKDVPPSRLKRALQEIQDLVQARHGVRIGLVAFATIAHVVTPITDDSESLLRQLPAISTDLVRLQGSRLAGALELANQLFSADETAFAHNILLVSDGDFADTDLQQRIGQLRDRGIRLHVLAVGTPQGDQVPLPMPAGSAPVISRLDEDTMALLAASGGGIFRVAEFRDDDTRDIIDNILSRATAQKNKQLQTRVWNEHFYWLILPAMLILLSLYRPGARTTGEIRRTEK